MSEPSLTDQKPARSGAVGYGGQAVVEGIMIRGPRHAVVVCRRPDGSLISRSRELGVTSATRARRIPLLRGVLTLGETLQVGLWALMFASRVATQTKTTGLQARLARLEERVQEAQLAHGIEPPPPEEDLEPDGETGADGLVAMALALSLMIGLLFVVPVLATHWIESTAAPAIVSPIAEGVLRLLILLGYMQMIGRVPSIRRTFQYHAAEHKTIAAWEAGDQLTRERVSRYSRAHPRCGTSFLLAMVIVAFIVFLALGNPPLWLRLVSRIALIPVIVAIAYEMIRLGGKYRHHAIVAWLFAPNLWLQALTTREPEPAQIDLAIVAMESALQLEREADAAA